MNINSLDSFVIDDENKDAHDIIKTIIDNPVHFSRNPICLIGGKGLKKCNLLNSLAEKMELSGNKVHHIKAYEFCEEYVEAIINNAVTEFRNLYDNEIETLIIEDVSYLCGKSRTQEELTNRLINRYEKGKMTIFSSPCHPSKIKGMDEWLSSRLVMGVTINM